MPKESRSVSKWIALVLGWIAAIIGGLGFIMATVNLLPVIADKPSLIVSSIIPTLVWLIGGILLIRYGLKKEAKAK